MSLVHHNWQNPIYFINGVRLWADNNGVLRYKQGVPTSHNDGTPLLLADGSIAMTSDLDMGTHDITNVGNVDGVDVSSHADRHEDGGDDEIELTGLAGDNITVDTIRGSTGSVTLDPINTDTITEETADHGVEIEGVLIKDGEIEGLDLSVMALIYDSADYHDATGDSDLLNAYQALSAEDIIAHDGRLYVKTTYGIETMDGECIINGSFENLDASGGFEFWDEV